MKLRPATSTLDGLAVSVTASTPSTEAYRLRDLAAFSLGARLGRKLVLFGLGRGWQAELEAEQDRR